MIALITLLACAVIALRGYVPGGADHGPPRSMPSAVAVALMPVLFTVSVVILLAGVLASQHRLPLAMPDIEVDERPGGPRLGRGGLVVLGVLAAIALLAAAFSAIRLIGGGADRPPPPPAAPTTDPSLAPQPPSPATSDGLSGTPLLLTTVAAVALVVIALAALSYILFKAGRQTVPRPESAAAAADEAVDSLTRAAEMGLAAMIAPGQDPRTAIIACYVAMERGLAFDRAAAPLISDTPMEVLARAFERGALHDASARELVALFEEARFSPHSMLEWQRMRAEQLLRIVLADLQGKRNVAAEGVVS
ncbi:DUF4129 domain-containing protein [Nocardia arizonensis]|uniref:DUF4129 domain-containing protein n=1 Tax=Nocardia arizonensis TaxID=1141647 RepID=UPI0006CF7FED|nr:DUF4129 domain-containing protein [Nocardia arizonensis]